MKKTYIKKKKNIKNWQGEYGREKSCKNRDAHASWLVFVYICVVVVREETNQEDGDLRGGIKNLKSEKSERKWFMIDNTHYRFERQIKTNSLTFF